MTIGADERIASIRDRLDALRQRTDALIDRAREATSHALEVRAAPIAGCNHAEEARRMQADVDALAHELEGLRDAMATRAVIEQAKGMLMLRHGCGPDAAFARLVELSQTTHRKLVEVAQTLVVAWSEGGVDAGP